MKTAAPTSNDCGLAVKFVKVYVYDENGERLGSRNHFEVDDAYCPLPRGPFSKPKHESVVKP